MELLYDYKDRESILKYANILKGKTLKEAIEYVNNSGLLVLGENNQEEYKKAYKGKGGFGQHLEKEFFKYEPNNDSEADFFEAGVELKSSPLKMLKNKNIQSKERLVLNIINYMTLVNEKSFIESSFYKKNAVLLLVFYLHESGISIYDLEIHLVGIWELIEEDLVIIERDWQKIKQKIIDGRAHEISEGDTFYLGACTKGANAKSLRKQPFSTELAKQRAFSFKQGYVNHIIANIAGLGEKKYGRLISNASIKHVSIEDVVYRKFSFFIENKVPVNTIVSSLNLNIKINAKNKFSLVTKGILGVNINQEIEEFIKAGITIRTVRLGSDGLPKESISFPAFEFMDLVNQEWEDSVFYNQISNKFLFVFLKELDNKDYYFESIKIWNMPLHDIEKVELMFDEVKRLVLSGEILKEITKDNKRKTNFPGTKFNGITHIRPHGKNAKDTYPLPVPLKITKETEYTKQCFWLNASYVKDAIYLSKSKE